MIIGSAGYWLVTGGCAAILKVCVCVGGGYTQNHSNSLLCGHHFARVLLQWKKFVFGLFRL